MPASIDSRISYSWRAWRLVAKVRSGRSLGAAATFAVPLLRVGTLFFATASPSTAQQVPDGGVELCVVGARRLCRDRGRRRQLDHLIRQQADALDRLLGGGQPLGRRDPQAGLVAQFVDVLDGALAERLLADQEGPAVVPECAGHDLGGAGAALVDQHDDRRLGRCPAALGPVRPAVAVAAL